MRLCVYKDLGFMDYQIVWGLQEQRLKQMIEEKAQTQQPCLQDNLFFCEHPPVYTIGKSGNESNLLISQAMMQERDVQFFHSNRGGDVTFHGREQLVAYPLFDLEAHKPDIGLYIRNLEEVVIRTLKHFGLVGMRSKGQTGVWLDVGMPEKERKICAIGVRCSRWITMHGLAFNINTDLSYFNDIIPCGIANKKTTSLQVEMNKYIDMSYIKKMLLQEFKVVFNLVYESHLNES